MARVDYLDEADVAPEFHDLLARRVNLNRALIHSPHGARAFWELAGYIRHASPLDPRVRQLAILQIGWVARSPYEWSHHIKLSYGFGVSDDDIAALIDESNGTPTNLDPLARLALLAAREMYAGPGVGEATFAALAKLLTAEHLTDLVVAIGFYIGVVRILASLQIDVEPEYEQYLERYPLPAW